MTQFTQHSPNYTSTLMESKLVVASSWVGGETCDRANVHGYKTAI